MSTRQVLDFYHHVQKHSGQEVASEFLHLMKEWDGCLTTNEVVDAFYSDSVLIMKHKEAREVINYKSEIS